MTVEMTEELEKQEIQNEAAANEDHSGELNEPRWSVVTFESVAVSGLSYNEAVKLMNDLKEQNISGLCIISDEAAARFSK